MAKNHKRLAAILAVGIAVSVVAVVGSAFIGRTGNAFPELTDKVKIVEDPKLPAQWVINAAYGRGALSNLRAALSKIAGDNAEEAKKGIVVAQSLLAKINRNGPFEAAQSVKSESYDAISPEADLILIHSEVRVINEADPDNIIQTKLDEIRHELEMDDHASIVAALESLNIPLAYTRVDLPLSRTIALVNESLKALESHDAAEARSKLLEVGKGLRIQTVRVGADASAPESSATDETG